MKRRYCLTLDLKDDAELIRDYRRHHQAVWPEITDSLRQAGILDLEIYLLDTRLVMILEVDERFSFEEKARIDRDNPRFRSGKSSCGISRSHCLERSRGRNGFSWKVFTSS